MKVINDSGLQRRMQPPPHQFRCRLAQSDVTASHVSIFRKTSCSSASVVLLHKAHGNLSLMSIPRNAHPTAVEMRTFRE